MNFAACEKTGISRQRGFWLRCFLGRACLLVGACLTLSGLAWARVEPQGPLHVWRIHGFFMNPSGKPLENIEIKLVRDGKVAYTTKTDASGRFEFDHVYGRYSLHIERSNDYSQLAREVIVGEAATVLRNNTLYVIAGPGGCTDDCSSVFTSKGDFEKAVRRNTRHRD